MSEGPVARETVAALPPAHRGLVRRVLVGTVLGALVFLAMSLYADLGALGEALAVLDGWAMVWALVLATGNYGIRYLRWQYYLRRIDVEVDHGPSLLVFLSGFLMSVTPGKVGELFKSLLLFEYDGTPIARTAPVIVAERLTDLIALVLLTAVGALAFDRGGLTVSLVGAALVGVILVAASYRPIGELCLRLLDRVPVIARFVPRLRVAYEALRALTRPVPMAWATVLSIASWGLEGVALWVLVRGFPGAVLGWPEAFFTYSFSTIAGALLMLPGGLGVTEASMTGLLVTLGEGTISTATATAATMLCRLATLWWAVVIGAVALALFRFVPRPAAGESEPPNAAPAE